MTVYVAGRYTDKARCRMVRATLVNAGFPVRSRWLYESTTAEDGLADVRQSDVLVLIEPRRRSVIGCYDHGPVRVRNCEFCRVPNSGGGRYLEVGYALARKMPVLVWDEDDIAIMDFWELPTWRTLGEVLQALAAPAFRLIEGPIA